MKRLVVFSNNTHYQNFKLYLKQLDVDSGQNHLIITNNKSDNWGSLVMQIKDECNFESISVINISHTSSKLSNWAAIVRIIYEVKRFHKRHFEFDHVIFSSYYLWSQHFTISKYLNDHTKVTLLNDGLNIFSILELRKKTLNINYRLKDNLLSNMLHIKDIPSIEFFVPFKLRTDGADYCKIFDYEQPQNYKIDSSTVYFIGSPLVETGIVEKEYYLQILSNLYKVNKTLKIKYFAHRAESDTNLKEYSHMFEIIRNHDPFETFICNSNILPKVIISFYSSVLLNLFSKYSMLQFKSIEIESMKLIAAPDKKVRIIKLYNLFRQIKEANFMLLTSGDLKI